LKQKRGKMMRINEIELTQPATTGVKTQSSQELQVQTLKAKSKEVTQQAEKASAQQKLAKAQQKLAKATSTATIASPTV
jgi:hypothetical protein